MILVVSVRSGLSPNDVRLGACNRHENTQKWQRISDVDCD